MAKPPPAAKRHRPAVSSPMRPQGRSLGDFGRLSPAERKLLDCCRCGELALIGDECPEEETGANRVRAAFVRFLALGGDEAAPMHEHGTQLQGAWLTGVLDLDGAKIENQLKLSNCRIQLVQARRARISSLSLDGSRLMEGLLGESLRCGDLRLRLYATGPIRLIGALIDGDLDCYGGVFENPSGEALLCDSMVVSGSVHLSDGFESIGMTRMVGASVGGMLNCQGGRFDNGDGFALACNRVQVSGTVFLSEGFSAIGTVHLVGAKIGGDLNCISGSFEIDRGMALSCDRAQIEGGFFFRSVVQATSIDMGLAQVGSLIDDAASWALADGKLILDGFTYGRFAGGAPTDAAARIAWLRRQRPDHLEEAFQPQPWEQLAATLRAMGHPDEARAVAVAKQTNLRRAGRIVRGGRILHILYGLLVGYGYRPLRLLVSILLVWGLCGAAYWAAASPARFGMTTHLLAPPGRESNGPAPDYGNFVPLIYSADVLLPVVDLGYKDEWQPVVADRAGNPLIWGQLLRFLYWFEIAFGWVAGLLLIGVLGNLIKKD